MSRSYKKPYHAITNCESSKQDKVLAHRKFRRINKIFIKLGLDKLYYKLKEISDNWGWNSDGGKVYWGNSNYADKIKRK